MSAFLGPIHYWLYNKIQNQQTIVDELYSLGEQLGISLQEECEDNFGTFENKPLEEMIDHGNIHGWLQEKVSQVEYKYAYCVTNLLNDNSNHLDQMKYIHFQKGSELGRSIRGQNLNAPGIFNVITDNLLDGMPCDHANSLVDQTEIKVIWKRNLCVHEEYWVDLSGDVNHYYELRNAWIDGFVKETEFTFHVINSTTYSITKED